jgi:hypothetical protein
VNLGWIDGVLEKSRADLPVFVFSDVYLSVGGQY